MPSFRTTRRVRHSAADMFDLVSDVERYPEFLPLCQGLRVRRRSTDAQGRDVIVADMDVGYRAIRETFTSRITLDRSQMTILVEYVDGPFRQLENKWGFKDEETPSGTPRCAVRRPPGRHTARRAPGCGRWASPSRVWGWRGVWGRSQLAWPPNLTLSPPWPEPFGCCAGVREEAGPGGIGKARPHPQHVRQPTRFPWRPRRTPTRRWPSVRLPRPPPRLPPRPCPLLPPAAQAWSPPHACWMPRRRWRTRGRGWRQRARAWRRRRG